jgi:hypothetical protein
MHARTAICLLAHRCTPSIAQRFDRLRREAEGRADCYVMLHDDGGPVAQGWREFLQARGMPQALWLFRPDTLVGSLGYQASGTLNMMGSTHMPLTFFARSHGYAHWWQVESDVDYRGNWGAFFDAYRGVEADVLASHVHHVSDWPTWSHWQSLVAPLDAGLRAESLYKAFFPVSRFSAAALRVVDHAHAHGWAGHFEALIPTLMKHEGLTLRDLRSVSPCYVGDSQNPAALLPLQSTMRWRPLVTQAEFAGRGEGPLLFHPIKENWCFDGARVVRWPEAERDPLFVQKS